MIEKIIDWSVIIAKAILAVVGYMAIIVFILPFLISYYFLAVGLYFADGPKVEITIT